MNKILISMLILLTLCFAGCLSSIPAPKPWCTFQESGFVGDEHTPPVFSGNALYGILKNDHEEPVIIHKIAFVHHGGEDITQVKCWKDSNNITLASGDRIHFGELAGTTSTTGLISCDKDGNEITKTPGKAVHVNGYFWKSYNYESDEKTGYNEIRYAKASIMAYVE